MRDVILYMYYTIMGKKEKERFDEIKFITVPMYDRSIAIHFTTEEFYLSDFYVASRDSKVELACCATVGENDRDVIIAFNLEYAPDQVITPGTVAHEALHAASAILYIVGMGDMSENNEEAFAYLLGWIVDQVYKFVDESPRLELCNTGEYEIIRRRQKDN